MGVDTFYELTRRSVPIIKNEAGYLSWRNSVLTLQTSKRVHFLEYSYNLEYLDKNIPFIEFSVPSPKESPATELCNSSFLKSEMRNIDYTEMIVNPSFWPHNASLTQEMTAVTMIKWSPPYFKKSEPVLAVLNNIGGVEIFSQHQSQWKGIMNLCPYIQKTLQYNKLPRFFDELKESVLIVETCAICWAPKLNPDNSCYFVTAQKNGTIIFWQIFNNTNTVKVQGYVHTDMIEMTMVKWIPKSENKFYILCANDLGVIYAFDMQMENEAIKLVQPCTLWPHKDRMTPKSFNYTVINNHIVFICSKHRYLLIQVLSEDGAILAQYLNNVNDYRITDITATEDGIYLATVNVKIYKLNITYLDGNLNVVLVPLDIKDPYTTYELYSLRFSKNNVLCALAMVDRRVLWRKEAYKMEIIFLSTDSMMESIIPKLIDNPTKKLTYHWDCIELLRFQLTKQKIIPQLDFFELYDKGLHDAYSLKIYLIVTIFFHNLKKLLRNSSNLSLPEYSVETIREKILYLHAQSLLKTLCNKCQNEGNLNDIEMETLYGSKNYLEYYAKKYKIKIEFDTDVLNALDNNCEYVCQCCDDKIEGFSCKNGHLNMFCMESFTPITSDDYLLCKCCGFTARSDLKLNYPMCVLCDLYLVTPD